MQSEWNWIVFTYRIASDTSTLRVRTWRILRRIGAVALQPSTYVVPSTPLVTRKLLQLKELVEESGGETGWLDVLKFSDDTERMLIQRFNRDRTQEFEEWLTEWQQVHSAEVPVDDADYRRLEKRLRKLESRDYFHCLQTEHVPHPFTQSAKR